MPQMKGNQHGYGARLTGQEGVRPHQGYVKILHPYPKNNWKMESLSMRLIQSNVNFKKISLAV